MSAKSTRSRRSKAEVQQEFAAIAEEVNENKSAISPKDSLAQQMKEAEVRDAVSGIAVEAIIHKLADLNVEISKSLSHLSEKLAGEIHLLNQVRSAISIEHENLQKLHKIDTALTALDQLVEEYHTKSSELELEIATKRKEWGQEQDDQRQAAMEFETKLKVMRQREKEEFEYKKDIERKKEQDQYEESCRLRDKQTQEKQEALEKNWQLREEVLKEREDRLEEMQQLIDTFPSRLSEEKEKSRLEATAQTEHKFSQEMLTLQKDKETDRLLSEMKTTSLEEALARQSDQIIHLQRQLEEAKREVKEIAEKAIEGASGAKALSHINQIAIEQAKNRSNP